MAREDHRVVVQDIGDNKEIRYDSCPLAFWERYITYDKSTGEPEGRNSTLDYAKDRARES